MRKWHLSIVEPIISVITVNAWIYSKQKHIDRSKIENLQYTRIPECKRFDMPSLHLGIQNLCWNCRLYVFREALKLVAMVTFVSIDIVGLSSPQPSCMPLTETTFVTVGDLMMPVPLVDPQGSSMTSSSLMVLSKRSVSDVSSIAWAGRRNTMIATLPLQWLHSRSLVVTIYYFTLFIQILTVHLFIILSVFTFSTFGFKVTIPKSWL
jgi:hypothetical protein